MGRMAWLAIIVLVWASRAAISQTPTVEVVTTSDGGEVLEITYGGKSLIIDFSKEMILGSPPDTSLTDAKPSFTMESSLNPDSFFACVNDSQNRLATASSLVTSDEFEIAMRGVWTEKGDANLSQFFASYAQELRIGTPLCELVSLNHLLKWRERALWEINNEIVETALLLGNDSFDEYIVNGLIDAGVPGQELVAWVFQVKNSYRERGLDWRAEVERLAERVAVETNSLQPISPENPLRPGEVPYDRSLEPSFFQIGPPIAGAVRSALANVGISTAREALLAIGREAIFATAASTLRAAAIEAVMEDLKKALDSLPDCGTNNSSQFCKQ